MPKYGLFTLGHGPYQTYEGDYLMMDKEFVKVMKYMDDSPGSELVAAIRLDKGQSVKPVD